MGGILDATNVVQPKVTVITHLELEHTEYLGDTIEKIAFEKAGIIKPGVPVVVAPQEAGAMRVIEGRAGELGAQVVRVVGRQDGGEDADGGGAGEGGQVVRWEAAKGERGLDLRVRWDDPVVGANRALNH